MPNLLISKTDALGADRTPLLASVKQGDVLLVTDPGGEVVQVKVTGTPVASSTYYAYPYDSFTAGTEPTDEEPVDLSVVISGPAGPEGGADSTHPAAPTWPATPFETVFTNGPGGDPEIGLQVTVIHPTLNEDATPIDDLAYTRVQVALADPASDPEAPTPDWAHPTVITVPADQTSVVSMGIRGGAHYWARARSFDKSNNGSAWTTPDIEYTTRTDGEAPGMPQSVELTGGFKGFGARWQGSDARDLMFYELRYVKDVGGVPGTDWTHIRSRANAIFIGGLELDIDSSGAGLGPIETKYWVQVRAIDFSGNVVTSAVDPTSVPYDANFEAGYTDALSVMALPIGTDDIAADAITANMIATIELDAGVITSGYIKVATSDGFPDGIEMYSGGVRVGKWDESGLVIGKLPDGLPFIENPDGTHTDQFGDIDYLTLTNAGLTVYRAGVATTAITPDGIDASAINFGTLPGGHNIVKNTSFELAGFVAASSAFTFDTIAQFQAQDVAGHTNVGTTYTGDKVAMTTTAY
jgi:hypothetical protein